MEGFLKYVSGKAADSDFSRRLDEAVIKARMNQAWRKEFMDLQDYVDMAREEERANTEREKARADNEKARADNEKARADNEKARADNEKARADAAEERAAAAEAKLADFMKRAAEGVSSRDK